jgi:methylenetetrahydrofolate dehydrogenase (NADP+)/methenyltetrahydrofolate cyclohydrolase
MAMIKKPTIYFDNPRPSAIFEEYEINLGGKDIVIVGAGILVGQPVSAWFSREGFSYRILDKENFDHEILKNADIIISGAGVPGFIKPGMIKEGSVLIDAGTSTSGGKLLGDVDIACYDKGALVSGVPGGIGPVTVASLFRNLFLD